MAQGIQDILKFSIVLLIIRFADSQQIKISNNSELINIEKHYFNVESKNASDVGVEMHFVFDVLKGQKPPCDNKLELSTTTQRAIELKQDLENVLLEAMNGQWSNKHLLLELADLSKDINTKIKIFTVLWKTLQSSKKIYNPFELITLHQQLELALPKSDLSTSMYTTTQLGQINQIKLELRNALTDRSSQMLEAAVHIPPNNLQNTTLENVLQRINGLEDAIFVETLDKVFDAVEDLVTLDQLALALSNFSINTKQSVISNLQLLKRVRSSNWIGVKTTLLENLKKLVNEDSFGKLSPEWQSQVFAYLPLSMRNLYKGGKLCIRNATNPTKYLSECSQTYLMCTNERQLVQLATFSADRNKDGLFAFRSLYWANRYIRFEGSNGNGNITLSSSSKDFLKNIYSKHGASYWHVLFNDDFAVFVDPSSRFYLCAGNSEAWNGGEEHVYTRNAAGYSRYQHECQWAIEDCNAVVKYF